MPSTKIHDISIFVTTPLVYTVTQNAEISYCYLAAGLFLSPDLDIHSHIYQRWFFLKWYWLPYQWIIKHRSWLSHSGPLSAIIRAGYCAPIFLLLYWYAPLWVIPLLYAMILSDSLHTVMDIITTGVKTRWNRIKNVQKGRQRSTHSAYRIRKNGGSQRRW